MLASLMRVERRYLNGQMPVAAGGWCTCCSWCSTCHCWCHIDGAVSVEEDEEL